MRKLLEQEIKDVKAIPNVTQVPVMIYDKDTGYKAITTVGSKETLSIVTNTYQPVQHGDVWNEVEKLNKYKIERGMLYDSGRVLMIEITDTKPQKIELIPNTQDYLIRKVRVFNSYDGTRALSVQSYGLRLICTNGMIAPGLIDRYKKIHTYQNIKIVEIGNYIELGMEAWIGSKDLLLKASKMTVDVEETLDKYTVLSKKYIKVVKENLDKKETVYDIWNELTRCITHDVGKNVKTRSLVELQQDANKIFNVVRVA